MGKETAEQKLLKLIEATNAQAPAGAAPTVNETMIGAGEQEAQKVFQSVTAVGVSGMALPPFLLSLLNIFQGFFVSKGQGFGLKEFNRIFLVVIILFAVFFSTDLMKGMERSKAEIRFAQGNLKDKGGAKGATWAPVNKPFAEYAQVLAARNIFQPFEIKVTKKAEKTLEEKSGIQRIADQIKDLKLVGISWLDTPESASAMIENTSSGTTYFLGIGDRIQSITIKKIYADSIVIGFDNEEMELRL